MAEHAARGLDRPLSRRTALAALGVGGAGALAGCAGFGFGSTRPAPDDALLFTFWGGAAERTAFGALAEQFRADTGITVVLQPVPFSQQLTTVDTGLRAGAPPDVFRVTYNDIGFYRAAGVLAGLPDPARLQPAFAPAFWGAVSDAEGVFGVPHHTDTSMLLVNTDAAAAAGIARLPERVDQAWSWEEFHDVATRMAPAAAQRFAFAVNWQDAGAYRWLNWVDQGGGRLLAPELSTTVDPQEPGLRSALAFTRSFFTDGLVPPTSSTGGRSTDELFTTETAAMGFVGSFLLADIAEATFPWRAVPLPRSIRASADLGGNALVATAGPRAAQALQFVEFCVAPEQMAAFCSATAVLPTRTDVDATTLDFPTRPETMIQYAAQAETIRTELVEQVTVPAATAVNAVLRDGLERAFLGDDPDDEILSDLLDAVDRVLRR